jgi:tryptophanase
LAGQLKNECSITPATGSNLLRTQLSQSLLLMPMNLYTLEQSFGYAVGAGMYITDGIRAAETGTFMFGCQPDGSEAPAAMDLVRLAMPRRVYTQSQGDYIVECLEMIYQKRDELTAQEITWEPPSLRHFTAKLQLTSDKVSLPKLPLLE